MPVENTKAVVQNRRNVQEKYCLKKIHSVIRKLRQQKKTYLGHTLINHNDSRVSILHRKIDICIDGQSCPSGSYLHIGNATYQISSGSEEEDS